MWAIVPVKPLRRSKSRLAGALTPAERAGLSEELLRRTLDVIRSVSGVVATLVVSRDGRALALARRHGARGLAESGGGRLNAALSRATDLARRGGAASVLVLPADLPLVDRADVEGLIAALGMAPALVIAPDRRGQGTNALVVSPPGLIEYEFGPESFRRHVEAAHRVGARLAVCQRPGLGFDLDIPEDLARLPAARRTLSEARRHDVP